MDSGTGVDIVIGSRQPGKFNGVDTRGAGRFEPGWPGEKCRAITGCEET